ncbi:neuronal acetylcholine receptor subunit alpha-10-like [Mercenaria mercenaria]|uniref:neuronal acetylcholine receptor subunit alpha-10-like n=1 Tax=Mercenaria mercenaria TaxID=6596 RepID=UPI00234EBD5A|nr:neuronal acetylcholine receptor subunit alpha-10-like [Mercenaria mercenaria]
MENMYWKGSFTFTVILILQSVSAQYRDINRVITRLQNGYRKEVLPTRTSGSYVAVKVYPAIVRIEDLDPYKEELSSTISLSLHWTDERLAWDPRDYGGVTEIHVPASTIWLPDISVYNTISPPETFQDQMVEVSSLGQILYVRNVHARSFCHMDLTWFPRDQHTCEIIFSSWIYPSQKVMMEFMHVNTSRTDVPVLADTDPNIINLDGNKWQLRGRKASAEINLFTYSCCLEESYVQLNIALTVKRNVSFLTDMFIFPMLVISVLVPFQFLLPSKTSQRPAFGLLLVFGEILPLIALCLYVPAYSNFPFIGIINLFCIISATCALVISTVTTSIGSIDNRPVPACLKKFLRKVAPARCPASRSEKKYTINNLSEIEHDNLLHENHYIEMDAMGSSNEPNGSINGPNGLSNQPNGITNEVNNPEMTQITQSADRENIKSTLSNILNEFKHIHSLSNHILAGKEKQDWLTFSTFLDKVSFLVFLVLFVVQILVLCLSL